MTTAASATTDQPRPAASTWPAWETRTAQPVIGVNPLRGQPRMRDWLLRDPLVPADLIAPLLVQPANRDSRDYAHQAGAVTIVEQLAEKTRHLRGLGVRAVKLFAYVADKTPDAAAALEPDNLLVAAIRTVREAVPDMVIATEVCGCAWTTNGECVLLNGDHTTNARRARPTA